MKIRLCVFALAASWGAFAAAEVLPVGDCAEPQARTDLTHCDFSHRKLAGRDLSGAGLAGVMLDNADLRGALLAGQTCARAVRSG